MRIFSDSIYTPFKTISNGIVKFNTNGIIQAVAHKAEEPGLHKGDLILSGKILLPGFIDIHTHGGYGVAFGLGSLEEELEKYSGWAASTGVTGFLLSITGPDPETILQIIREYARVFNSRNFWPGAIPLGLHLEGPYLNPEKHGAFDPAWLHPPQMDELKRYLNAGGKWIKQVSLAPELDGAMEAAQYLSDMGITAALGHSNTDYETAKKALGGPFSHVTHTFNAQSPLHHRTPGVVGAILASEGITTELIGDGIHVHPAVMKILFRCIGSDSVVLITDAMQGAGLPDGTYELMKRKITVKDGKATLPDGTIASSTATMRDCLQTTVEQAEIPFAEVVRAAAFNPAKTIAESDHIGSIEVGKQANFTVLNEDFTIYMTIIKGKTVYQKEGS